MINLKMLGVISICVAASLAYAFLHQDSTPTINSENDFVDGSSKSSLPSSTQEQTKADNTNHSAPAVAASPIVQQFKGAMGNDEANQEDVKNWFLSRGYSIEQKSSDYESYDEETLKPLAKSGDLQALALLEKIYANKHTGEGAQIAREFRLEAAVHGSTAAITSEAFMKQAESMSAPSEAERRRALLESMAWFNTNALRGDMASYYANETAHAYNQVIFTSDERQQIASRAQEIYAELEAKRIEKGLGNFDNSVPDSVKEFFDRMNPKK